MSHRSKIVGFLMAGVAVPAIAQTTSPVQAPTPTPAVSADAGAVPTDIIVTAQRRSENLERVPVAVSVVTAETLAKQNITSESDLQFSTPGLQVRTGSSATQVTFAVRGQTYAQFSGTRPGVLPYFNEVQVSSSIGGGGGTTAFYDLQSVQLLKGPQGTLFGRTATGGAVLFTTTKPGNDFGGYGAVRIGDYNTQQVEGAVNIPIVKDTLLTRLSGFYGNNRGYQTNIDDGSHPGSERRYGLRGSVTFKSGNLHNDLVIDYYHSNGSNVTASLYSVDPVGSSAALYSPAFALFPSYVAARNDPNVDPAGLSSYFATQKARGPFTIASDSANIYRVRNIIVTNATTLDLTDNLALKNIFGYSRLKSILANDSDGTAYGIAGSSFIPAAGQPLYGRNGTILDQDAVSSQYSDELQLQGKTDRLTYTAGLFYSDEKGVVVRPSEFFDILRLVGPAAVTTANDELDHHTYAGYAQGTYDISGLTGIQGLAITGGVRYTSEHIEAITLPLDSTYGLQATNPALFDNDEKRTINNVSWTVGLKDQVNSNLLIYAASRRAYKNGGFNTDEAPQIGYADTGGNSYKTETVTDAELGAKYQTVLAGAPLRVNIALFHDWISDSQRTALVSVQGSPAAVTVNVPKARVYGLELDGAINPTGWLSIGGSLNYIHSRFTSQLAFVNGTIARFATYPDTPDWSGTFYAEVTVPVSGNISGTVRGDVQAQTKTFFSSAAQDNPAAVLPGYAQANFRVGVEDKVAGWSLSALVKNAFDKTYYTGGLPLSPLIGINTATPAPPRSFIVEARFKF